MTRGACWKIAVVVLAASLSGCAKDDSELRSWISQQKSREPPPVDPIPFMAPYEKFLYAASHLRDPFEDILRQRAAEETEGGPGGRGQASAPDTGRRREALENYPLDALRMVGTLERDDDGSLFALIQGPDDTVTRVTVGNYLGQNYGRVTAIADFEVQLTEKIPDGAGGWMDRETSIAIIEAGG